MRRLGYVLGFVFASFATPLLAQAVAEKPAALVADGIPAVPLEMVAKTRPYMEFRTASFQGWNTKDRSMLISTRFGNTAQLHRVAMPMGARTQISFEAEPVGGTWSPKGDVLVVSKDIGGSEFFQLYTLNSGQLTLLTDGKSRNAFNAWSHDGHLIAYTSTRRNGTDNDIYVVNPRDPKTNRLVAEVKGGGWSVADFAPDGKTAIVEQGISVTKSNLFLLDIQSGVMRPLGNHTKDVAFGSLQFAKDGTLWATSDEGAEFLRLGTIDLRSGIFTPKSTEPRWDITSFDVSDDNRFLVYTLNEAGISKLKQLNLKTGKLRVVEGLPSGGIGGIDIAPWGEIGLTFTSAKSAADAYSIDPETLKPKRWTLSETGGLDASVNVEPEFIEVKSFDGQKVSGFLYRPDPKKFAGPRPLIINIHGGPEAQWTPGFLGRSNYLLNELGIAIFYPNVRGSTGFGKTFVGLDNGPFKREDSVKDIGAYLDHLQKDAGLDKARFAVTGGSYGGYMCYAVAIRYGEQLKGANCVVAISNFVTFLENTQSYRRDLRRVEYGDERDPVQRKKLTEISPLTSVSRLNIPLLVVTGSNDPRVPQSEADQMVAAVRAKGQPAWHLVGTDEGHGFAKKVNQDYNFYVNLMFWQKTLMGQ
jgi:dipeptidyl aminopeptidase/acylaminoacyl peptidase